MIRVYHDTNAFGPNQKPCYKHVADVNTDNLDKAYALTNHADHNVDFLDDWALNTGVRARPGNHRSTSVGDLMLIVETPLAMTGIAWKVCGIGFVNIGTADVLGTYRIGYDCVPTSLRSVVARIHKFIERRLT